MLDLKSKLLAAGLVTEEQVDKVKQEEEERRKRRKEDRAKRAQNGGKKPGNDKGGVHKGRPKGGRGPAKSKSPVSDERIDAARWQKRMEQLKAAGKSEQYDAIRAWVQRARIDAVKAVPTDAAERFHFARYDSGIASLVLEPEIKTRVIGGEAGISAYMSHNGLAHCVVPRDVAMDIAALRPEWVRVLDGYEVVPNQDERKADAEGQSAEGDTPVGEGAPENPAAGEAVSAEPVTEDNGETVPTDEASVPALPSAAEAATQAAAAEAMQANVEASVQAAAEEGAQKPSPDAVKAEAVESGASHEP